MKSVQKNQAIKVYKRVKSVPKVSKRQSVQCIQSVSCILLFLLIPARSVLFEVHVFNGVREIHGIVSFTVHFILRSVVIKVFKCFNQCSVCSVINVKVFNEYKGL